MSFLFYCRTKQHRHDPLKFTCINIKQKYSDWRYDTVRTDKPWRKSSLRYLLVQDTVVLLCNVR